MRLVNSCLTIAFAILLVLAYKSIRNLSPDKPSLPNHYAICAVEYLGFDNNVCPTDTVLINGETISVMELVLGDTVHWEYDTWNTASFDSTFIWKPDCKSHLIKLSSKEFEWMFTDIH